MGPGVGGKFACHQGNGGTGEHVTGREESCKGGPRWWLERPTLNVRVRVCPRAVSGTGTPSPKHECTVGQAAVGVEPPGLEPSAHMGTRRHLGVSPSWKFMKKVPGWADKS